VSDPALSETIRQHLVDELMDARRAVKAALPHPDPSHLVTARARVHDAKVALGERGPQWWEPMPADQIEVRIAAFERAIGVRAGSIDVREALALPLS